MTKQTKKRVEAWVYWVDTGPWAGSGWFRSSNAAPTKKETASLMPGTRYILLTESDPALERELKALRRLAHDLNTAIDWALGAKKADGKWFESRKPGDGPYWWRNKLSALQKAAAARSLKGGSL